MKTYLMLNTKTKEECKMDATSRALAGKQWVTKEVIEEPFIGKLPESGPIGPYRVEVQADSSGTWAGNGLTFATVTEAAAYARDLFYRWTAVREWRVVETETGEVQVSS